MDGKNSTSGPAVSLRGIRGREQKKVSRKGCDLVQGCRGRREKEDPNGKRETEPNSWELSQKSASTPRGLSKKRKGGEWREKPEK